MTTNSLNTFHQTTELRQTNKQKVLEALRAEDNQSRFEVGRHTGLGDWEAQKRISDLVNDGKVVITGSRKHGNNEISLYSIKKQLSLFPEKKKPSLRNWLKKEYPEILYKYELLIKHEL